MASDSDKSNSVYFMIRTPILKTELDLSEFEVKQLNYNTINYVKWMVFRSAYLTSGKTVKIPKLNR